MLKKLALGGIAAALALSVAPAAQAETIYCAEGFEAVCYVYYLAENALCHLKYNPC
jgi:hypothetical protein